MDITGIATVISAACSVASLFRKRHAQERRSLDRADIKTPPGLSISEAAFAELTVALYNTYDAAELQVINNRLADCRQQFMQNLNGQIRQQCICRVLREVADGNGGALPTNELDDTFRQLC